MDEDYQDDGAGVGDSVLMAPDGEPLTDWGDGVYTDDDGNVADPEDYEGKAPELDDGEGDPDDD